MLINQVYPYDPTPLAVPLCKRPIRIYYPLDRTYNILSDGWKYLWEASIPLTKTLCDVDIAGKRVLNIRCGLGLIAVTAKLLGAKSVYAYDTYEECPFFISLNARSNAAGEIIAVNYIPNMTFDVVIGADTLYQFRTDEDIQHHIDSLMRLVSPTGVLLLGETQWMDAPRKIAVVEAMTYDVNTTVTEEFKWWDTPEDRRWNKQVYIHRIQHH